MRLLVAGTNHFDFNATVLGAASSSLVVCDGLLLALAFGVDAICFNALGNQVGFDSFSATDRQTLVVSVGTDGVGMANGDDDFQVHAFELGGQVVQLRLAVRLQNGL